MSDLERPFKEYLAQVSEVTDVRRGFPLPLGAHEVQDGVNFALYSRGATRLQLELFAQAADSKPERVVALDPVRNRTGDVWHVWIKGIAPGQLYAYRADGRREPMTGRRCNFNELLLDPYATAVKRPPAPEIAAKCVLTRDCFDWRDDQPPRLPWSKTIIYETHVRGFTAHPSSAVRFPGSYRGLTEKIPYLKELGVTALELLPVQELDATDRGSRDPRAQNALKNYWGYGPVALFAPNGSYSSAGDSGGQTVEFKEMVRHLHAAGIEVIIDAAGGDKTIDTHHPAARQTILNALRHWVAQMHVDGFRLDLVPLLGCDSRHTSYSDRPLLEQIAEDPILRDVKLIATGWNSAGAYEVESFPERHWAEMNSHYRDDVRRFWRGDPCMSGAFASRICGSEDLYAKSGKGPECGINFTTSHDGFTLNDLVSFQTKHNLANGENDRDGTEANFSANYGAEGPSEDPRIEAIRRRQVKNFILTLFVSRGVPMLLGGDEFRRTQLGNNNAYCQDNVTSWYDWNALQRYAEIHDFVRRMTALRRAHPVLSREQFYTAAQVQWFDPTLAPPSWNDPGAGALGCLIHDDSCDALYLVFNARDEPVSFSIPVAPDGRQWQVAVDTARDTPVGAAVSFVERERVYMMEARSSALLVAPSDAEGGSDPSIDHCAGVMGKELR